MKRIVRAHLPKHESLLSPGVTQVTQPHYRLSKTIARIALTEVGALHAWGHRAKTTNIAGNDGAHGL